MVVQAKRGINLLRSALRRAGVPLYWHKNSPKTYTVHQHAILLLFRRRLNTSYVDYRDFWLPILTPLCRAIGLKRLPEQSTLCKEEHRLRFWTERTNVKLIQAILPERPFASGDGTGLSFANGSSYYVGRILGQRGVKRKGYARVVVVNTTKNIILASGIRVLPTGELSLLRRIWKKLARKPSTLVWDKAGDSEKHHAWLKEQGVRSIAPVRENYRRGRLRKALARNFPQKIYNKRNHSETTIRLYKQSFGGALKARSIRGRRAELAMNTLTHNLSQRLKIFIFWTFQYDPTTGRIEKLGLFCRRELYGWFQFTKIVYNLYRLN